MKEIHFNNNLFLGFDFSEEDLETLIVSRKDGEKIRIVNVLFGEDAKDIYNKLVTPSHKTEKGQ